MTEEQARLLYETAQSAGEAQQRISELFDRQNALDKLVQAMCGIQKDIEYTKKDVTSMKNDIKDLKEVPKKRYDAAVIAVISAIVGAVITFFLGR